MPQLPKSLPGNLVWRLFDALRHQPERHVIGLGGDYGLRWWTRSELLSRAERSAAWLASRKISPKDRIALQAPNSPEWAACLLGALRLGAVPVLIDADTPAERVERLMEAWDIKILLVGTPLATGGRIHPITDPPTWLEAISDSEWPNQDADDPALIVCTSGTTETPRAVVLTHGNLLAQLRPFAWLRFWTRFVRVRLLLLPPFSHVYGLVVGLLLPVFLGLSVVCTHSTQIGSWLRLMRDFHIAILIAVPRALDQIEQRLRLANDVESSGFWRRWRLRRRELGTHLKAVFVGGSALAERTARAWWTFGLPMIQGYGLSETSGLVSLDLGWRPAGRRLGRPLGGQELKLAEDGEILVRGDTLASRYLGTATFEKSSDGFLKTGDLGAWSDGRLFFIGRKKDQIVTAEGFNVDPGPVETSLIAQPGVNDAALIAHGEDDEVHAVVCLQPGVAAAEVIAVVNRGLAPQFRIRDVTVWPEVSLPRTSLGKLRREEIRQRLLDARRDASPHPLPEHLEEIFALGDRQRRLDALALYFASSPDVTEIEDQEFEGRTLEEFGLTSLELAEVLFRVAERRGTAWQAAWQAPRLETVVTVGDLRRSLHHGKHPSRDHGKAASESAERLPSRQPAWAESLPLRLLRRPVRATLAGGWALFGPRVEAVWPDRMPNLPKRFLIAATPHRHWADALIVYRALPRVARSRLMVFTDFEFRPLFAPKPKTPWRHKVYATVAYFGLPFIFSYAMLVPSGRVRDGLEQAGHLIDRRYCPIAFPKGLHYFGFADRHDPGPARLAKEAGLPILPVYIEGNDRDLGWRLPGKRHRITVRLGRLIETTSTMDDPEIVDLVEKAFRAFAEP